MTKPSFFLDLLVVLVFAAAGRASHALSGDVLGVLATAWPFLVGMVAGWLAVLRQSGRRRGEPVGEDLDDEVSEDLGEEQGRAGRRSLWWLDGLVIAVSTLVIGMLLRSFSGGGTALPFVLVATAVLVGGLVGWRAVAALLARREPSRAGG